MLSLAALIVIIPYWKIFGKAGFPRIFGLFMIVPLVNLILLYVLAFSQWRVLSITNRKPIGGSSESITLDITVNLTRQQKKAPAQRRAIFI